MPGDTAAYFAGPAATPQAIEEIRKRSASTGRCPSSSSRYVRDLARGDLGNSLTTGQPVVTEIPTRLPASAELTLIGLIVSMLIAVPLGILAAVKQGSFIDHACRVVATAGVSLPVFFTGLLLVYVFYFIARLGAGAARAARRVLLDAAARHRLLPDRQPDRARPRDVPCGAGAARAAGDDARASSRSPRSPA